MPTIIEMVNHTRLDCLLGRAAGMRRGLAEAVHHARHRSAFGKLLAEQPAMQNVLADLAIESEAATVAAMRVARAYDEEDPPSGASPPRSLKYWVCKRGAAARGRGARVPGRQRLRRGVGHAAAATATRRSTRSGRARATWRRWTCCARWRGARGRCRRSSPSASWPRARDARLDAHLDRAAGRPRGRSTPRTPSVRRAGSWRTWRSRSRPACWCATPRPRWPTPSAPAGSASGGRAYGTLPKGVDAPAIVERALAA